MITITPDATEAARETEVADRILGPGGKMNAAIERRLKQAALEERLTHRYQNQTGHLQQSTAAVVVSEDDDGIEIHLEMGEEYASHVVKRGYSDFEKIAEEAFADVEAMILAMSEDL